MANQQDITERWIGRRGRGYAREIAWMVLQAALGGLGVIGSGILDALHESRRRQSMLEIARHRHLMDAMNSRGVELPWESENG